jgi:Lon protease-like protein
MTHEPTTEPTARVVPMFPLGTVLFPWSPLPLHVFEPRYRAMVADVLAGDGEFGVVLIERGSEVGGGDVRFGTATLTRLVQCDALPDGRFALTAFGIERIRVVEWLVDDPYPRAVVVPAPLAHPAGSGSDRAEIAEIAARVALGESLVLDLYRAHAVLDARVRPPADLGLDPDPMVALWQLAARTPLGALDAHGLLDAPDAAALLDRLEQYVADQILILRARAEDR